MRIAGLNRPNRALICGIFTTTQSLSPPLNDRFGPVRHPFGCRGGPRAGASSVPASRILSVLASARRPRPPRERAPDQWVGTSRRELARGRRRDFTQKREKPPAPAGRRRHHLFPRHHHPHAGAPPSPPRVSRPPCRMSSPASMASLLSPAPRTRAKSARVPYSPLDDGRGDLSALSTRQSLLQT